MCVGESQCVDGGCVGVVCEGTLGFPDAPVLDLEGYGAGVAAAELNGDGTVDLAITTYSGIVSVFFGNGNGTFAAKVEYPAAAGDSGIAPGRRFADGDCRLTLTADAPTCDRLFESRRTA